MVANWFVWIAIQPLKASMDFSGTITNLLQKGKPVNLEFIWQSLDNSRLLTQSIKNWELGGQSVQFCMSNFKKDKDGADLLFKVHQREWSAVYYIQPVKIKLMNYVSLVYRWTQKKKKEMTI